MAQYHVVVWLVEWNPSDDWDERLVCDHVGEYRRPYEAALAAAKKSGRWDNRGQNEFLDCDVTRGETETERNEQSWEYCFSPNDFKKMGR